MIAFKNLFYQFMKRRKTVKSAKEIFYTCFLRGK